MSDGSTAVPFASDEQIAARVRQLEAGLLDLLARVPSLAREAGEIARLLEPHPGPPRAPAQARLHV